VPEKSCFSGKLVVLDRGERKLPTTTEHRHGPPIVPHIDLSFAFPFCCIGVSWAQCAVVKDSQRLHAALHAQPRFYGDCSIEISISF
jgi:hypothetical protein